MAYLWSEAHRSDRDSLLHHTSRWRGFWTGEAYGFAQLEGDDCNHLYVVWVPEVRGNNLIAPPDRSHRVPDELFSSWGQWSVIDWRLVAPGRWVPLLEEGLTEGRLITLDSLHMNLAPIILSSGSLSLASEQNVCWSLGGWKQYDSPLDARIGIFFVK